MCAVAHYPYVAMIMGNAFSFRLREVEKPSVGEYCHPNGAHSKTHREAINL
jgi:hypothetical protein